MSASLRYAKSQIDIALPKEYICLWKYYERWVLAKKFKVWRVKKRVKRRLTLPTPQNKRKSSLLLLTFRKDLLRTIYSSAKNNCSRILHQSTCINFHTYTSCQYHDEKLLQPEKYTPKDCCCGRGAWNWIQKIPLWGETAFEITRISRLSNRISIIRFQITSRNLNARWDARKFIPSQ
jgi:hypothetical protein